MSNTSLKEQLLSLGLTETIHEQPKKKIKKQNQAKNIKPKPAWLEQAQYGVELLKAHFPACFRDLKEVQPLKIGIKQDLVKQLSTRNDIVMSDKACMVNSLSYYVNSPAYLKNMLEGASRIDLDGQPAGTVTKEEAQYSLDCRKAKLQKKHSHQNTGEVKVAETVK